MKQFIANHYVKLVLLALIIALVALIFLFIQEYHSLQQTVRLNHPFREFLTSRRSQGPLTVQDINYIQQWMTFDYINHLFNFPPDYFKTQLTISDIRYPRLTINQYAQSRSLASADALIAVKNSASAYFTNQK